MIDSIVIKPNETFCEIGCGTGTISLLIAKKCRGGVAVDINPLAVNNTKQNAEQMGILNVKFFVSNCFENVSGRFDVLICNPPYSHFETHDLIDRMFWDPNNELKRTFFCRQQTILIQMAGFISVGQISRILIRNYRFNSQKKINS